MSTQQIELTDKHRRLVIGAGRRGDAVDVAAAMYPPQPLKHGESPLPLASAAAVRSEQKRDHFYLRYYGTSGHVLLAIGDSRFAVGINEGHLIESAFRAFGLEVLTHDVVSEERAREVHEAFAQDATKRQESRS